MYAIIFNNNFILTQSLFVSVMMCLREIWMFLLFILHYVNEDVMLWS